MYLRYYSLLFFFISSSILGQLNPVDSFFEKIKSWKYINKDTKDDIYIELWGKKIGRKGNENNNKIIAKINLIL